MASGMRKLPDRVRNETRPQREQASRGQKFSACGFFLEKVGGQMSVIGR